MKDPNMTHPSDTRSTLLMTTSLKGGTGKSFFACAALDYLRTQNHPVAAYDGDGTIGTLSAMHASKDAKGNHQDHQDPLTGVVGYNVRDDSRALLIESSQQHNGVLLHDLAGGALFDIKRIFDDQDGFSNLFNVFQNLNIRPVFCHLITSDKSTVDSTARHLDMMDDLGDIGQNADHLAVLNLRGMLKRDDFPFWYGFKASDGHKKGGKTRDRLLARGGVEMTLPHINEGTLALAKNCNMPLSKAVHETSLTVVERQRIQNFNMAFANAVTPEVRALMGLQDA